jgi:hypothetical protein
MVLDKNTGKKDEGIANEQAPRLTKLAIRQTDAPIELYRLDIVRSETGGRRIKNYANKTRDYEWWVDPDNRNWWVPDGNYLISQGPNLWIVNVADKDVEWRDIKTLAQRITAHWNKLTIEDTPADSKAPNIAPLAIKITKDAAAPPFLKVEEEPEDPNTQNKKPDYEEIAAKIGTGKPEERLGGKKKSKSSKKKH